MPHSEKPLFGHNIHVTPSFEVIFLWSFFGLSTKSVIKEVALRREDRQYSKAMTVFQVLTCSLLFQMTLLPGPVRQFNWDWHQLQSLSSAPSLKDANIAASDRAALAKAIEAQIGPPDPYDPELASEVQIRQAVLNSNIKMISVSQNEKDPPEVVALPNGQHFCSPTGNCSFWFFGRTPQGYRLLLDAIGQGFTVQTTATNGFRDLVINMHGSATDQSLKVYRYAGGRYRRVACYDANWAPLENGVIHQLKDPRITPSHCN
jgi:hypothetical protein